MRAMVLNIICLVCVVIGIILYLIGYPSISQIPFALAATYVVVLIIKKVTDYLEQKIKHGTS